MSEPIEPLDGANSFAQLRSGPDVPGTPSMKYPTLSDLPHLIRMEEWHAPAPGIMAVTLGTDHRFYWVNRAYTNLVGRRDIVGKTVREALPELEAQDLIDVRDRVFATGAHHMAREVSVWLQREPHAPPEQRFVDLAYQPILDVEQRVAGVQLQGCDVTERVRVEMLKAQLMAELNHRVKNCLATVLSLAEQTGRHTPSPPDFLSSFAGRVKALSRAHELLTRSHWDRVVVSEILERELRAAGLLDRTTIVSDAPTATMAARAAVSLALVVHELARNARRSCETGGSSAGLRIDLSIQEGYGRLTWEENAAPAEANSAESDAGRLLVDRLARGDLGGTAELDFRPSGLKAVVRFSLEGTTA